MKEVIITWRDAVTTLSAGGAVILERAYAQNVDWPFVSEARWVIAGLAVLAAITLVLGFAYDRFSNDNWDVFGILLGSALAILVTLGLVYATPIYALLIMLSAVVIWVISIAHHFAESGSPQMMSGA